MQQHAYRPSKWCALAWQTSNMRSGFQLAAAWVQQRRLRICAVLRPVACDAAKRTPAAGLCQRRPAPAEWAPAMSVHCACSYYLAAWKPSQLCPRTFAGPSHTPGRGVSCKTSAVRGQGRTQQVLWPLAGSARVGTRLLPVRAAAACPTLCTPLQRLSTASTRMRTGQRCACLATLQLG
jgi:hypothetical protein